MGTLGNVFHLFDVSLTEGTVAPPFVVPDYASELTLCQRYYEKQLQNLFRAYFVGTNGCWLSAHAVKRATPTGSLANITYSSTSAATLGSAQITVDGAEFRFTGAAINATVLADCIFSARL
jgi:hypothetical protein